MSGVVEMKRDSAGVRFTTWAKRSLLPGLINAHCHLDYTILRGINRAAALVRGLDSGDQCGESRTLGDEDYGASTCIGAAEAQRFGTTTMVNLTVLPERGRGITKRLRIRYGLAS